MKRTAFTFLILLICITISAQKTAQWRGENRDGHYNETELLKNWPNNGPKLLWHFDKLGPGHASAAVTSNKVYTAGTDGDMGFVIAFDHTGKVLWQKNYAKEWIDSYDGVRTTPLVIEDKLYIMSGYGVIVCMNSNTGKKIWEVDLLKEYKGKNIRWGVTENLAYDGNKIFVMPGGTEANVIALNRNTGELIWKSKGKGEISAYCSPTVINHNNKKQLITQSASHILGIDIENGQLLWSHHWPNQYSIHANTPIYKDGSVFIASGYRKGCVRLEINPDGKSVKEVWTNSMLDNRMGGVILLNNKLYGSGNANRKWFCVDWNSGNILYESEMLKNGNIITADGMLYCYREDGKVALIDPKNNSYDPVSIFPVPYGQDQHWAHSVIHNKKLYIRHGTSLMVYDISK